MQLSSGTLHFTSEFPIRSVCVLVLLTELYRLRSNRVRALHAGHFPVFYDVYK